MAENDALVNSLAEDVTAVVTQVAKKHTHILAASTNNGKNFMPRAAAILDSSPLSDILAVVDENTFKRPMYAGNAIATMKMTNAHKVWLPNCITQPAFACYYTCNTSLLLLVSYSYCFFFLARCQFLLVRPTAFEKAGSSGSAAPIEAVVLETPVTKSPLSTFLGASVTKSERPDLTAARGKVIGIICDLYFCAWID